MTTFTGVRCKNSTCDNIIALHEVWSKPSGKWLNQQYDKFVIYCTRCFEHHEYTKDDVNLYEGNLS